MKKHEPSTIEERFPELAKQIDKEKNTIENIEKLCPSSTLKIWWKCDKNHSWQSEIKSRTLYHRGCPYCSNKKTLKGYNDLATTNPELLKEWNYEKNVDISPYDLTVGSHKKVWWKCSFGHEWQSPPGSKVHNVDCPICLLSRQTSFCEQAVYYYIKRNSNYNVINRHIIVLENKKIECDIFIQNLNIAIEYNGKHWHNNKQKQDLEKINILNKNGIYVIRIDESNINKIDNNIIYYEYKHYNYSNLEWAIKQLLLMLKYDNIDININKDKINILELFKSKNNKNNLSLSNPDLSLEWNYDKNGTLTPEMFSANSDQKMWWKCKKGHEWQASIKSRNKDGNKCPYCSNYYVLTGYNDLKTLNPQLSQEWDYELNYPLTPDKIYASSSKKAWWKCSKCGNQWFSVIDMRNRGVGCPKCKSSNKRIKIYFEDGTNKEFNSISEASLEYNISVSYLAKISCSEISKRSKIYVNYKIINIERITN